MNAGTAYSPQTFALLLIGEPGAGKSTVAMGFPRPWFLDLDRNLASAIAHWKARGKNGAWWFDQPTLERDGKLLSDAQVWPQLGQLVLAAGKNPDVGTLVIDGLSRVQGALTDFLTDAGSAAEKPLKIGGEIVMTKSLWNPFAKLATRFIMGARATGKPVIVTSHVSLREDVLNGMLVYNPAISGQLQGSLGSLFTDVWLCDTEKPTGKPVRYFVRTAPTPRMKLKCSMPSLIPEFEFAPDKVAFLQPPAP